MIGASRPGATTDRVEAVEEPSWKLRPGQEITPGRRVVEKLGGGIDVEVYLVWDEHLFALAVAKLLRPHQAKVPAARAHLEREGLLALRLRHPHLAHGYALCLDGQYPHLLLEYAEGPTLRRLVRRHGPLAPEQWLPLAAHLASVLQYLHNEEVVHLDVKPANVVVGLAPRLVDLGIARSFEAAARLRDPIGSEAWMAPEQCDPTAAAGTLPGRRSARADRPEVATVLTRAGESEPSTGSRHRPLRWRRRAARPGGRARRRPRCRRRDGALAPSRWGFPARRRSRG